MPDCSAHPPKSLFLATIYGHPTTEMRRLGDGPGEYGTIGHRERSAMTQPSELIAGLRPDEAGLVAAVGQQDDTGEVLMLAWMNEEALRRTPATGRAPDWARS